MPHKKKATDEQLLDCYKELGSVWKVAKYVGMCGQTVHRRLSRLGVIDSKKWTKEEDLLLIEMYGRFKESMFLRSISKELKRSYASVACRAHHLKLTNPARAKSEEHTSKSKEGLRNHYKLNGAPEYNAMRGKSHTADAIRKMSQAAKEQAAHKTAEDWVRRGEKMTATKLRRGNINPNRNCSNPYSRTNSGKRLDLDNQFYRSSSEANCARYFNLLGYEWEYEPKDFYFEGIRRGCVSYTPDFYVKTTDQWIEMKGWFDEKSITKLNRFKKYYPNEFVKLALITQSKKTERIALKMGIPYVRYEDIRKQFANMIPEWEYAR